MNILVTGGAGFIGSFIVDELVSRGHDVTIFDSLETQVHPKGTIPDYLNKKAKFVQGDVRDMEALRKVTLEAEVIFHKAAAVGVGQSQYEVKRYMDINVCGTTNLLDILVNHKTRLKKLVVAASMSSYGEGVYQCSDCGIVRPGIRSLEQMEAGEWDVKCPGCGMDVKMIPTAEDADQNCNSIYAYTKKYQEETAILMGQTYDIPVVALRYFNVYGPRQSLSNPYTGVAAIFLSRIKNDKPPVIFEDGLQSRDFISVHDIVLANMQAMEDGRADGKIFNVGTGQPLTIREMAQILAQTCGKDIQPEITCKYRKGDVRHCIAGISKIKDTLDFEPKTSFQVGIKELIEWSHRAQAEDKFDEAKRELEERGLV